MKEKLSKIVEEALASIESSEQLDKLNDIKVAYLGKKGELTSVLKGMKDVLPEDRPKVGQMVNDARNMIEEKLEARKTAFEKRIREEKIARETIDVTLPGKKPVMGHKHPNTIALDDVERIFTGMGYYTRSNAEYCLIATKGKGLKRKSRSVSSVIMTPIEEHSKKPDEIRKRIESLFGDLPRIELFARQYAEGWDCWGNEV